MRRFTRLGASAVIAVGSLATVGAFSLPPAHALGPEGCAAQNNNGVLAVGTVAGTTAPAPPSNSPPAATCTYTALSSQGGFGGGDSKGWSVTVDTAHAAATDATGKPCSWVADATTGISTWSGTGPAVGGYGCIMQGGSGTATLS